MPQNKPVRPPLPDHVSLLPIRSRLEAMSEIRKPGKMPSPNALRVNPRIESAFQKIADHFADERRIRKQMGYLECERGTLNEALHLAMAHPGRDREAWEWMSRGFDYTNSLLEERGLPLMRVPRFEVFTAILKSERKARGEA